MTKVIKAVVSVAKVIVSPVTAIVETTKAIINGDNVIDAAKKGLDKIDSAIGNAALDIKDIFHEESCKCLNRTCGYQLSNKQDDNRVVAKSETQRTFTETNNKSTQETEFAGRQTALSSKVLPQGDDEGAGQITKITMAIEKTIDDTESIEELQPHTGTCIGFNGVLSNVLEKETFIKNKRIKRCPSIWRVIVCILFFTACAAVGVLLSMRWYQSGKYPVMGETAMPQSIIETL